MSEHCFSCGAFGCMLKCKQFVCTGSNYWLTGNSTILVWNLLFSTHTSLTASLCLCTQTQCVLLLKTHTKILSFPLQMHAWLYTRTNFCPFFGIRGSHLAVACVGACPSSVSVFLFLSVCLSIGLRAKWATVVNFFFYIYFTSTNQLYILIIFHEEILLWCSIVFAKLLIIL